MDRPGPQAYLLADRIEQLWRHFKEGVKSAVWPGQIFEALGIKYMGPIDGHDLPGMINMLGEIKHVQAPILLHVKTVKGQGYEVCASEPTKMPITTGTANKYGPRSSWPLDRLSRSRLK